jgi:hypothetical protein
LILISNVVLLRVEAMKYLRAYHQEE